MRTHIYYFSGTGNSLSAARLLAAELGDCEVISIADAPGMEPDASFDRLGIVFPVYSWGLPLIVRDFLKKVKTDKYVFAVATNGGWPAGAIEQAERILSADGVELKCGMGVKMPDNCIILKGAPPAEKQERLLGEAATRIKKIAAVIMDGQKRYVERGFFLERWLLSGFVYGWTAKNIRSGDRAFIAESACNACGICARICPVKNIEMSDEGPRWLHHCEQCMACLQWCPKEAIQAGGKTRNRKRYRNPAVGRKDFIRGR